MCILRRIMFFWDTTLLDTQPAACTKLEWGTSLLCPSSEPTDLHASCSIFCNTVFASGCRLVQHMRCGTGVRRCSRSVSGSASRRSCRISA